LTTIRDDLHGFRAELRGDLATLRADTAHGFEVSRADTTRGFETARSNACSDFRWIIGIMLASVFAILASPGALWQQLGKVKGQVSVLIATATRR
jgi:hypothetical protein